MPLLLHEVFCQLRDDVHIHLLEIVELFPKFCRFIGLLFMGLFIPLISVLFGGVILTMYLWGEADWSEKLTRHQKIWFWLVALPIMAGNYLLGITLLPEPPVY